MIFSHFLYNVTYCIWDFCKCKDQFLREQWLKENTFKIKILGFKLVLIYTYIESNIFSMSFLGLGSSPLCPIPQGKISFQ